MLLCVTEILGAAEDVFLLQNTKRSFVADKWRLKLYEKDAKERAAPSGGGGEVGEGEGEDEALQYDASDFVQRPSTGDGMPASFFRLETPDRLAAAAGGKGRLSIVVDGGGGGGGGLQTPGASKANSAKREKKKAPGSWAVSPSSTAAAAAAAAAAAGPT
eukprot:COSAG06_NODE_5623_length_3353_cov_5.747388_3_plen_160_part_00